MQNDAPRIRRHSFRTRTNSDAFARPISDLNITPLIDVLLVLLVMLMLSIPIATHSVKVDLPNSGPASGEPPVINMLRLNTAGVTMWNDRAVQEPKLKSLLHKMARDPNKPVLHMQTDARARYERFDQTIAIVKKSGVQRVGFIGNDRFEKWDQ